MLQKFLTFDSFITPSVLKIVYYVMAIITIAGGLVQLIKGLGMMGHSFGPGLGLVVASIVFTALGVIFWRVSVEAVIAFFQIRDALVEGKGHGGGPEA